MPVLALVEENRRAPALRAKKRAGKLGLPLNLALAAADLPLAPASIGAALLDSLIDIEDENAATDLLLGLLPALQPGGMVIALDATKKPDLESRIREDLPGRQPHRDSAEASARWSARHGWVCASPSRHRSAPASFGPVASALWRSCFTAGV